MHSSPANENVRAAVQILWKVDYWSSMGRRCCWLKSGNFKSEVGQCSRSLTKQLVVFSRIARECFPWNSEALAVDEVSRRGSYIRLYCGPDGQ